MNIHHHPRDATLTQFSLGRLSEAWSLPVATHLGLCPACRRTVRDMEALAGCAIAQTAPTAMSERALTRILTCLDEAETLPSEPKIASIKQIEPISTASSCALPSPLTAFFGPGELPWRRIGPGAFQILLKTSDMSATPRLLRIPAGRPAPEHGHQGPEMTLVLKGAFFDGDRCFRPGDLQEADEHTVHTPRATPDEDCICLTVTDAPLRFSGILARIAQPFTSM